MTEKQFRAVVQRFVTQQGGQKQAARALGVSYTYLRMYLKGEVKAGPKIARFFGLVPVHTYVTPIYRYLPLAKDKK